MLDYQRKYSISEFSYCAILNENNPAAGLIKSHIIDPALQRVHREYGINFTWLNTGEIPSAKTYTYVLYGPVDVLNLSIQEKEHLLRLSQNKKFLINIISAYELENGCDSESYVLNRHTIPTLSKEFGINVIYPDNCFNNIRTVDAEDVADNIICETIRVKYNPVVDPTISSTFLQKTLQAYDSEIQRISDFYKTYKLWHRAPTDGAVAIIESGQILLSQTKTNKEQMSADNFSLITDFDPISNTVHYSGEKLPSSDGPEFLTFNKLLNEIGISPRYIIHFHKNEIIRSPKFESKLTDEKIEYGKFESGYKLFDEYFKKKDTYLFLREHGIVWWGDRLEDFENFLKSTLGILPTSE